MLTKPTLDPVTFEVLKNSFITSVDQMAEQILRTCYSFVIYNRDFSSALHDANGECAAQGNQDIAVHVGTLHFTCKDVMRHFEGDMHEGEDRKSTRLNSSHVKISYAVFCLKKKNKR